MKTKKIIFILFFITSFYTQSQSFQYRNFVNDIKSAFKEKGYRIIDDGGGYLDYTKSLITDPLTYRKGVNYLFIAVIECKSCYMDLAIRNKANNKMVTIYDTKYTRYKDKNITVITYNLLADRNMYADFYWYHKNRRKTYYIHGTVFAK